MSYVLYHLSCKPLSLSLSPKMTVFLPLNPESPLPPLPTFLVPPANSVSHLARVIHAIMKAKRIVVICGPLPFPLSFFSLFLTQNRQVPEYPFRLASPTFDHQMVSSNPSNEITPAKPWLQVKNSLMLPFSKCVNYPHASNKIKY